MKKIVSISILSLLVITSACKKGDNDPFISLQSRTARISGSWKVTTEAISTTDTDPQGSVTVNSIYNGRMKARNTTTRTANTTISVNDTIYYSHTLVLNNDGTYVQNVINNNGMDLKTFEGTWIFLGESEINNLKNKEAILLTKTKATIHDGITTNVLNYTDLDGITLVIDELRSNKMVTIVSKTYANEDTKKYGSSEVKTTYTR